MASILFYHHHMFYRVYTVRSIPCLYEVSLLAATKMLNKESLSTSLSAFLIRRLCFLITIEKMFNVFHFGNKFAYSNMKNLDKNVFGTDLSSSKLWLATFLLQQGDFHGSKVNEVHSSIPPYALYYNAANFNTCDYSKQLYVDMYCTRNLDVLCRAKESWLDHMHFTPWFVDHFKGNLQLHFSLNVPSKFSISHALFKHPR